MAIKIIPPDNDRKELFEKSVKPLLVASEKNNAVDKWMFNLTEDGEVNTNSVVFVSTQHKKIFVIEGIHKTKQPPPQKPLVLPDLSHLPDEQAKKYAFQQKRDHSRSHALVHGLPKKVRVPRKNGTWKEETQTWSAHLGHWHLHNGRYIGGSLVVYGTGKVPDLSELASDIDFDLWMQDIEKKSFQPYQQISSKWKMNKEY
ncbi:hypothetical protein [Candidatus Puniceispirillum marinum]|uniref:Oxidoreductase domain protein n=1 Tax=Puniceispirillum marinum (strain IMCC1322) TaxID=488538 RepID=D5BTK4_PUNMI|nr:hypothetical protein [Candidatus Puniceispirillum marinum]ADE39601.1 oxidoreductase domain protein [Candidatus Puniceispirillum marinum IMCC1322]